MHQSNLLLDQAPPDQYLLVAGMGRSGTTWLSQIINSSRDYRILFEPFLAARTPEAGAFRYCQYVAPGTSDELLESAARAILAGKVSNSWIDRDNLPGTYRKRLVKDIRCNLMLGWLAKLSSQPIVLIIRHPLQVAHSWLRLGWGKEADGSQDVFDLIVSQSRLLEDFPLIKQIAPTIAQADFYLRIVFLWCVFHYVPRHHLRAGQAHVVFYESLLQNRLEPLESLFEFLKIEFDQEGVERVWRRPSSSNFLRRDFRQQDQRIIDDWKTFFSKSQVQQASELIDAFGLGYLYDSQGMPTRSSPLVAETTANPALPF